MEILTNETADVDASIRPCLPKPQDDTKVFPTAITPVKIDFLDVTIGQCAGGAGSAKPCKWKFKISVDNGSKAKIQVIVSTATPIKGKKKLQKNHLLTLDVDKGVSKTSSAQEVSASCGWYVNLVVRVGGTEKLVSLSCSNCNGVHHGAATQGASSVPGTGLTRRFP